MGGVFDRLVDALLADQPVDLDQHLLQLPARSRPRVLGHASGRDALGRELPAGARRRGRTGQDPGRLVGGVYAANTVGAIVGSLATSLILIPVIGTQMSEQILIGIAALSGLLMLMSGVALPIPSWSFIIVVAFVAGLLARVVPPLPGSSSPMDVTRRRGCRRFRRSARTRFCMSAKASWRRWPFRVRETAC
jgi:hypothetical protein